MQKPRMSSQNISRNQSGWIQRVSLLIGVNAMVSGDSHNENTIKTIGSSNSPDYCEINVPPPRRVPLAAELTTSSGRPVSSTTPCIASTSPAVKSPNPSEVIHQTTCISNPQKRKATRTFSTIRFLSRASRVIIFADPSSFILPLYKISPAGPANISESSQSVRPGST